MTPAQVQEFFESYIETALWSSLYDPREDLPEDEEVDWDEEVEWVPMDSEYGPEDLDEGTRANWLKDCTLFLEKVGHLLTGNSRTRGPEEYTILEYAGHDFWLTRNHHGAGFWDGDWNSTIKDDLVKAAESFQEVCPYVSCGRICSE